MAPRIFWKGFLKLSLVTCPVAMMPAITQGEKVRFHTLNRTTGHRVESRYVDAETNKPVDEDDEVKGYERGENDYVMLEDDELESIALESTRTIDIDMFVPKETIDWIWYDRPHYLTPDDPVGEEAFSVIRDAMAVTGTVGISRLVLYRRERAVMLEPRDRGIVVWTLRYGDEVRDPKLYFGGASAAAELVSAAEADVQLFWGEPLDGVGERIERLRALSRQHDRDLPPLEFGLRITTLVRDTTEEAWADAEAKVAEMARIKGAGWHDHLRETAVGQQRLLDLHARGEVLDDNLYTAPGKFGGGGAATTWLVGSAADVARSLRKYRDLGVTQFVLSDTPYLSEIRRQGEQLLPLLRN